MGSPLFQCPLCNRQVSQLVKATPTFAKGGTRVTVVLPGPPSNVQVSAKEIITRKNLTKHFELLFDPGGRTTAAEVLSALAR